MSRRWSRRRGAGPWLPSTPAATRLGAGALLAVLGAVVIVARPDGDGRTPVLLLGSAVVLAGLVQLLLGLLTYVRVLTVGARRR